MGLAKGILMAVVAVLEYVLPLVGKLLEKYRAKGWAREAFAYQNILEQVTRLVSMYRSANADGKITATEAKDIMTRIDKVVEAYQTARKVAP